MCNFNDSPKLSPELLSSQLSRALDRRTGQDTILWTMFAIFGGANGALAAAYIFKDGASSQGPVNIEKLLWVGILGATTCLIWKLLQARALLHIMAVEASMRWLEAKLEIPQEGSVMPHVGKWACGKFPARSIMVWVVDVLIAVWLLCVMIGVLLKIRFDG